MNPVQTSARRAGLPTEPLKARFFGSLTPTAQALTCDGRVFEPDEATAYCEFKLAHGFPVVSAYGTAVHPGTVAHSFQSMVGKPINYAHLMRVNDRSQDQDEIRRDYILGCVMAAEFPTRPVGGWAVGADAATSPGIRGVGAIFKLAERVPSVLGEHLAGRHRWTVSMEMPYELVQSGFIVGQRDRATRKQKALLDEVTPKEFTDLGFGYVAVESAPDDALMELVNCWDFKKARIKATWGDLPVVLLMGGINGRTCFHGIGIVRYGAEREAEITRLLATDPERLTALEDDGFGALLAYFEAAEKSREKLLTAGLNSAGRAV